MPQKQPPHEDCLHFASLLRMALQRAGLTDPVLIGELAALAQETPVRESLPYHPAVVTSWMAGSSVPGPAAFSALQDMLMDTAPAALEDAYEAAWLHAPHSTEMSIVFRARMQSAGFTLSTLAKTLAEHGYGSATGMPLNDSTLSFWGSGKIVLPDAVLPLLDQLLPAENGVALQQLRALSMPNPDEALEKAAQTGDIHRALRYLRRAVDLSYKDMAKAITTHLPGDKSISGDSVRGWELLSQKKGSHLPIGETFRGTDAVTLYGAVLSEHGRGGWFADHENHLRGLLEKAVRQHMWSDQLASRQEAVDPLAMLEQARQAPTIHRALYCMREALGMSHQQMAASLSQHMPYRHPISRTMVAGWEGLDGKAKPHLPSRKVFHGVHPLQIYQEVLQEHGYGAWAQRHLPQLQTLLATQIEANAWPAEKFDYLRHGRTNTTALGRG